MQGINNESRNEQHYLSPYVSSVKNYSHWLSYASNKARETLGPWDTQDYSLPRSLRNSPQPQQHVNEQLKKKKSQKKKLIIDQLNFICSNQTQLHQSLQLEQNLQCPQTVTHAFSTNRNKLRPCNQDNHNLFEKENIESQIEENAQMKRTYNKNSACMKLPNEIHLKQEKALLLKNNAYSPTKLCTERLHMNKIYKNYFCPSLQKVKQKLSHKQLDQQEQIIHKKQVGKRVLHIIDQILHKESIAYQQINDSKCCQIKNANNNKVLQQQQDNDAVVVVKKNRQFFNKYQNQKYKNLNLQPQNIVINQQNVEQQPSFCFINISNHTPLAADFDNNIQETQMQSPMQRQQQIEPIFHFGSRLQSTNNSPRLFVDQRHYSVDYSLPRIYENCPRMNKQQISNNNQYSLDLSFQKDKLDSPKKMAGNNQQNYFANIGPSRGNYIFP